MNSIKIEQLAQCVRDFRAGMGIREAAKDAKISPSTLSRVENGRVPDLETFGKICRWMNEDPAIFLGIKSAAQEVPSARVHFKKGATIKQDTAKALSEMIILAQQAFLKEELDN